MKIHYLFSLLKPLQILLIRFCKCCFFISELVWSSLFGSDKVLFQTRGESEEYREILGKVCMPGENGESLWTANEKSMKQTRDHFSQNKEKGTKCDKLVEFVGPHLESSGDGRFVNELQKFPVVAKHFPALDENCIRLTALSLLNVIIHLIPLHKNVNKLNEVFEAYEQSLELMSFVDNSDPQHPTTISVFKVIDMEADRVGVAVYKYQSMLEDLKKEKNVKPQEEPPTALEIVKNILKEAEEKLSEQELPITEKGRKTDGEEEQTVPDEYCDSRDWSEIAASYSKYRVCKLILTSRRSDDEVDKWMDYLYRSLADVIVFCLLKFRKVMVKTCREWAVKFEEQKIWDAMYAAGKFVGVMEKCNVDAKANCPLPYKDAETQTDT